MIIIGKMINKKLVYLGNTLNDTPIFNININFDSWLYCLEDIKKKGTLLYNSEKVYYYKLNNIDIIETVNNNKNMYNLHNFNIHKISNSYLKLDMIEDKVEYITPEFDYYNKQKHKLQVFNIHNINICFDEYTENGNIYYNIYSIINNDNDIEKFMSIINNKLTVEH